MSKKQSKSVEKVEEVVFCQHCKFRKNGADAKREQLQGYCPKTDTFVNRKHEVCSQFRGKKNA
jgi:hypothetical protein